MESRIETEADLDASSASVDWVRWNEELRLAGKERADWLKRAQKIMKRYKDMKKGESIMDWDSSHFNLFWSSIQIMQPATYARTPKPAIERRFRDRDQVGRVASLVLERGTTTQLENYDFNDTIISCRDDFLLVGFGQAWIRYVPEYETTKQKIRLTENIMLTDDGSEHYEYMNDAGEQMDIAPEMLLRDEAGPYTEGEETQEVTYEQTACDYIHYSDFRCSASRRWPEVTWVAKRVYMTREQLIERFGDEVGKKVKLDVMPRALEGEKKENRPEHQLFKRAEVWEIWDKNKREVIWFSKSYETDVLDKKDDPLGLKDFFPCPKPLLGTTTTDSIIPSPDFDLLESKFDQIDLIDRRLSMLGEAVRVTGAYDATCEGIQQILNRSGHNELYPIGNWPQFAQGGGLKGAVDFLPIDNIVAAMKVLYDMRQALMQDILQLWGISDIMRGATDPNETAKAQGIKSQYGQLRLSEKQREVARFARDIIRIKAEIIAEQFSDKTLAMISGAALLSPQDQQLFPAAVQLLRIDPMRNFRIDIESDSTIALDENQEKQSRNEFVASLGQFLPIALQIGANVPALVPMLGELLLFQVRGFRQGRSVESSIEDAIQSLQQQQEQAAQQPPQQPPQDPQAMAKMAEVQMKQQQAQADNELAAQKLQLEFQKLQAEYQLKREEFGVKAQVDIANKKADIEARMQELQMQIALEATKQHNAEKLEVAKLIAQQSNANQAASAAKEVKPKEQPQAQPVIHVNMGGAKKVAKFQDTPNGRIATIEDVPEGV